ncbi:hypothetical protein BZA77DRAFT_378507 [Pyronema omphalodes]|nr:hypothetical protein BZA77DRAFT_378507 [Pyronema omphalodes]
MLMEGFLAVISPPRLFNSAYEYGKTRKSRKGATSRRWSEYTRSNAGNDRLIVIPEEEPLTRASYLGKNAQNTPSPLTSKSAPIKPISILRNSGTVVNIEEATEKTELDIITTDIHPLVDVDNFRCDPYAINIDIMGSTNHADRSPYTEDDPAEPSVPTASRSRPASKSIFNPVPVVVSGKSLTSIRTSTAGEIQEFVALSSVSVPAPTASSSISSGTFTANTAPGPSTSSTFPQTAEFYHCVANCQCPQTRRVPFLLPAFGSFSPQIAYRAMDVIPEGTEAPTVPSQIPSFLSPGPCDYLDDYVEFGTAIERRLTPHRHFNLSQEVLPRSESFSCTAESFIGHDTTLTCDADTTINVCGDAAPSIKVDALIESTISNEAKVIRKRTAVPNLKVVKKPTIPVCDDAVMTRKSVVASNSSKVDVSLKPRLIAIPPRKSSLDAAVASGIKKLPSQPGVQPTVTKVPKN